LDFSTIASSSFPNFEVFPKEMNLGNRMKKIMPKWNTIESEVSEV